MSFSELKPRVKTASILAGAVAILYVIAIVTDYAKWIFLPVIFTVIGICAYEFSTVCSVERGIKHKTPLYFAATLLPALLVFIGIIFSDASPDRDDYFQKYQYTVLLSTIAGGYLSFIATLLYSLFLGRSDRLIVESVSREIFIGIFHIGVCGALLMGLVMVPDFQWKILWLMLVVFSNDTAAYFIGSKIGGPKLAPEISPNKTVSGALAGVFGGTFVGVLFTYLLSGTIPYTPLDTLVLGLMVTVSAQLGDLAKSFAKRLHSVKDTGSILPGHGGLLDRVDGLLMAAPALYLWLLLF